MANRPRIDRVIVASIGLVFLFALGGDASAEGLDELSLDRWKLLRETERYQLNVAEQYWKDKNYKVAASEYEKYLTLYERSDAAPYAQLKWSLCQVQLRRHNTAIKEGFQSVVDYWPDSPDAIAAQYYIGRTYKDIGRVKSAQKVYRELIDEHAKRLAAVHAMADLIEIAKDAGETDACVDVWRKLTFDVPRSRETNSICHHASRDLAAYYFSRAAVEKGLEALQTTYNEEQLAGQVADMARREASRLTTDSQSASLGERLADGVVRWLKSQMPKSTAEESDREKARSLWLAAAGVVAASRRDKETGEIYEQTIEALGEDDVILASLGGWHRSAGRHDEARRVYRRFKDRVEGLSQIALSYRQERKADPAVAVYEQMIGLDPESAIKWRAEIGSTYRSLGKHEQAVETYQELAKVDPGNADQWLFHQGAAYRDWKKYRQAIGCFRQAVTHNETEAYRQMAWCNRRLKQYSEAVILYNQLAGISKNHAPWAVLQIGYTYEEAGQKEKAINSFQLVCKNFPKDSHASQAHAHLQNEYKISVTLGGAKDE